MPDQRDGVRVEDGPKRVRAYLGGEVIADTTRPKLVWEVPYYPAYYFPRDDVRMELLKRRQCLSPILGFFDAPSRALQRCACHESVHGIVVHN